MSDVIAPREWRYRVVAVYRDEHGEYAVTQDERFAFIDANNDALRCQLDGAIDTWIEQCRWERMPETIPEAASRQDDDRG